MISGDKAYSYVFRMRSSRLLKQTFRALSTFTPFCQTAKQAVSMAVSTEKRVLTMENLNPHVIAMEYAVRGPLVLRALAIEKEIAAVRVSL